MAALGAEVAPGLFEAELHYLHRHEWARHADDVLWRRTKLGLHLSVAERAAVAAWCAVHWQPLATTVDTGPEHARENAWN
jgi:glycerol-3-phosphate dehydrogenase